MAIVKDLFHFIFSFELFMPVILWRIFQTSSIFRRLYSCFLDFLNISLQVSPFLHSFWPIFSHFMHFYPFHLFFALFCLQNSRKYSKALENTILETQFYNTSIFTSKASHSHIGGNIIFVRVLEDKNLHSHNINIPSAHLSVWQHLYLPEVDELYSMSWQLYW